MVDFPASHLWLQEGMLQVALDSGDHHHIYIKHQSVAKKHDRNRNNGALAEKSGLTTESAKTNGFQQQTLVLVVQAAKPMG